MAFFSVFLLVPVRSQHACSFHEHRKFATEQSKLKYTHIPPPLRHVRQKIPLVLTGGREEAQACLDPGARTPIGASGVTITKNVLHQDLLNCKQKYVSYFYPQLLNKTLNLNNAWLSNSRLNFLNLLFLLLMCNSDGKICINL